MGEAVAEPSADPRAPVYVDGKLKTTLKGATIAADFARILDEYGVARFRSSFQ